MDMRIRPNHKACYGDPCESGWTSNIGPNGRLPCPRRESGAFAIMFVPLLFVMLGFCGLALDIGRLYNRKVDLNGLAKAAAMAAAKELNGTDAGLQLAKDRAKEIVEGLRYQHFGEGIAYEWRDAAITFSTGPARGGQWVSGPSSSAPVTALYFVKVDTAGLDATVGEVDTIFMRLLSNTLASVKLTDSAVAGRTGINVTPLAVCAMSPDQAAKRTHTTSGGAILSELIQYGFRRGVSYDLMQLNPSGTEPARYLVNPVIAPGVNSTSFNTSIVAPFMCSGTMWIPRLTGGTVRVTALPSVSPLTSLDTPLNSRFDVFLNSPCNPLGTPPDFNIKGYSYDVDGSVKWMSPTLGLAAAATAPTPNRLETIADVQTSPSAPGDYGPLWAFAKAAKAPDPIDAPEPKAGYATFSTADWPTLYKSGPTTSSYPASTPYESTSSATGYYTAPRTANLDISTTKQRVLNIPLLSCSPSAPVGANVSATVLGIGRFFMTVPATKDKLIAEFAGLLSEQSISGQVELFQ
jgi:hypothetical protein